MKPKYDKPALTPGEQAELLFSRGLKGIETDELIKTLSSVSYYRLRGYMYPYQDNSVPSTPFLTDTSWKYIKNDYLFDQQFRHLIFSAVDPPSWMIFETASFGTLSKYFENIDYTLPAGNSITGFWGFSEKWVSTWNNPNRVYTTVCILTFMPDFCAPDYDFRTKLFDLMHTVRPEQLPAMGFPDNWQQEPLIKGVHNP